MRSRGVLLLVEGLQSVPKKRVHGGEGRRRPHFCLQCRRHPTGKEPIPGEIVGQWGGWSWGGALVRGGWPAITRVGGLPASTRLGSGGRRMREGIDREGLLARPSLSFPLHLLLSFLVVSLRGVRLPSGRVGGVLRGLSFSQGAPWGVWQMPLRHFDRLWVVVLVRCGALIRAGEGVEAKVGGEGPHRRLRGTRKGVATRRGLQRYRTGGQHGDLLLLHFHTFLPRFFSFFFLRWRFRRLL